ncbi:hypothetical protein OHW62_10145 [Acinetobacter baumannii]|nr:hypothetical protein [Acinetobacter baumannii]
MVPAIKVAHCVGRKSDNDIHKSYDFTEHTLTDKINKIKFEFETTEQISKRRQEANQKEREELCADLKGKIDRGVDRYAYCMGTKTYQEPPKCQNQYGDPCGTQYDKSRAGYTIKKN